MQTPDLSLFKFGLEKKKEIFIKTTAQYTRINFDGGPKIKPPFSNLVRQEYKHQVKFNSFNHGCAFVRDLQILVRT